MISVIENNKDEQICFHILVNVNFDEKIIKIIENKIARKLVTIKFYKIASADIKQIGYVTSAGYYRLYTPKLLSNLKRVLYLDDDIICTGSVKELYNIKLSSNEWLGAVRDKLVWHIWVAEPVYFWKFIIKYKLCKSYFNSGMMVMNLEALRKANIQAKWENLIANPLPHRRFNDQDIANPTCVGHVKFLDLKWNHFNTLKISANNFPTLIHYAGKTKPWNSPNAKEYSYWKKYANMSGLIDETN